MQNLLIYNHSVSLQLPVMVYIRVTTVVYIHNSRIIHPLIIYHIVPTLMFISPPIFWHDSFIDLAYWSITQTLSTWSNFPLAYRDNCGLYWRKVNFPLHHYSADFYPFYTVHAFSHGWVKLMAIDGNFCCSYISISISSIKFYATDCRTFLYQWSEPE